MKYIGAFIYIVFYGGLILPFTLGKIHTREWIWLIPKLIRWWIVWLEAFFWLIVSLTFFKSNWAFEMAASADQHGSAVLGFNKDNTISGILGERIRDGKATYGMKQFCKSLSLFDSKSDNHCVDSIGT